jgi:DNA-binding NarL/FixJ family response regulator
MERHASHLLVVVECPQVEAELREKLRCPADIPIRCEHAEDVNAALEALERRRFDLVLVATLDRDPREVVPLLESRRSDATVVVVCENENDVVQALDAGAAMAFERDRIPPGILPHLLDVALEHDDAFTTMELRIAPRDARGSRR